MRVLCLATEYPPAHGYGLGRYAHEHCQALAAAGVEVDVVCNNYDNRRDHYQDGLVQVHNVPFQLPFRGYDSASDILQGNVTLFTRAAQLLRGGRSYDVIQSHDWLSASAGHALRQSFGVPLVVAMHDTELGKSLGQLTPEQQYVAEMERWICEQADAVAANGQFIKSELAAAYGILSEKISVVGCGVGPERFEVEIDREAFRSLFCLPGEMIILFVGRLTPIKGPQVLLEALPEVLTLFPEIRMVMAGEGPMREPLRRRAEEMGIAERVRFIGYVRGKPLAAVYRSADVLVVPSLYEPVGMVALEGMVCGAPLVVGDAGGLSDIVEDGRTGLKVPPNDPQALARALAITLSRPDLASQRVAAAREYALSCHSWAEVAQRSIEIYSAVAL